MSHSAAMRCCRRSSCKIAYRALLVAGLAFALVACADAPRTTPSTIKVAPAEITEATPRFASGPIGTACLIHNRNTAGEARCGCIQAAANLTLSQAEQQRSVRFFNEPELLQTIKLSDTPENERFWAVWAAFAETAEDLCKGI